MHNSTDSKGVSSLVPHVRTACEVLLLIVIVLLASQFWIILKRLILSSLKDAANGGDHRSIGSKFACYVYRIQSLDPRSMLEVQRSMFRILYLCSFLLMNCSAITVAYGFAIIYGIDYQEAIYLLGAIAVLLLIVGNSVYVPYLHGIKLVLSRTLEYGKSYDLTMNGQIVHRKLRLRRMGAMYVVWCGENEQKVTMSTEAVEKFAIVSHE